MSHTHSHNKSDESGRAFRLGISLNIAFVAIEVLFGVLSNSMALVADAGHNFSDIIALVLSWIAVILSQRKPTLKFTYGLRRSTILAALLNTILLIAAVAAILFETLHRINMPEQISSSQVIMVASIGIVINGFTAWLFIKGKKNDLNIRSAFIHFLADTLVSFGVVVAGIIMALTGITWIDSLVSLMIAAVIIYSAYRLFIDSVNLALDAVPDNIDILKVREYLQSLPEVDSFHDLHIWALSTTVSALTVHLTTNKQTDNTFISGIQRQLHEMFGIEHATIQVEYGDNYIDCENCN